MMSESKGLWSKEMDKKKKSILVKFLIGILVLIIAIGYPYLYSKNLSQNWGCGSELLHGDFGALFFFAYILLIYGYIFVIFKPNIVNSMVILGILGIACAILLPNYRAHKYHCEMKLNFASLYNAEQKYFNKYGVYAPSLAELKWRPRKIERYCLFLSETESVKPPNFKDCALPKGVTPFASKNKFLFVAIARKSRDNLDVWTIDEKKELKNLREGAKN